MYWSCKSSQYAATPEGSGLLSQVGCRDSEATWAFAKLEEEQKLGKKVDSKIAGRLKRAASSLEGASQEQGEEASADHIAAISLPYALQDPAYGPPPILEMNGQDRASEITVALAEYCWFNKYPEVRDEVSHPHGQFRLSMFAQVPRTRALLGCPKSIPHPGEAGWRFPSTSCKIFGE